MPPPGNICGICGATYQADALFCPRDGGPLGASAPKGHDSFIGVELPGQIRIEQLIGIGSMGRVYRAFQGGVDRPVAVKILHKELSAKPALVARFHREAQIASRLSHPNVVQALMSGQLPEGSPGAGAMYLVMEYLDGISLRSALAGAGGAFPLPRALRVVLQLCEAVGEAHRAGVVHRDLKPENIMLLRREHEMDFVKVLDFGIARLPGANTATVTQAGAVFGTARYVSPEGALGNPVGPTADVYAIATILYQAVSGRTPFEGDTAIEVLGRQINEAPPNVQSIERAAYLPDPLAAVIMKNLAKAAERRSPDARALGLSLVEAARASGLSPEQLVPRSALFGPSDHKAAFASVEPTLEQPFTASLAQRIADVPPAGAPAGGTLRGPGLLAFVVGCLVGGAALAAITAYRVHDAPPSETAVVPPEGGRGFDAGLEPDGRAR